MSTCVYRRLVLACACEPVCMAMVGVAGAARASQHSDVMLHGSPVSAHASQSILNSTMGYSFLSGRLGVLILG